MRHNVKCYLIISAENDDDKTETKDSKKKPKTAKKKRQNEITPNEKWFTALSGLNECGVIASSFIMISGCL